ncbi:hypothetical protein TMM008_22730 [Pseudomonas sp. 008]|nr:hypothetical protein TMM008_22730 [Pseudomonas sp. 008]
MYRVRVGIRRFTIVVGKIPDRVPSEEPCGEGACRNAASPRSAAQQSQYR